MPIQFPDAELVAVTRVRAGLDARLTGADAVVVGTQVPSPRPPRLVTLRRTGGVGDGIVLDRPRLDARVWAADDHAAMALASLVRGLLFGMRGRVVNGVTCYRVAEFVGPVRTTDPVTGTPLVFLTVEIYMRGRNVP